MEQNQVKKVVECLFFVANSPLTIKQLAELAAADNNQVSQAIAELCLEYEQRGFNLQPIAGGWQFMTDKEFAPQIEKLYRPKMQQLSKAAMETLAIIAYKQPITRAEVAAIRQVDVDSIVTKLLEKGLIKDLGRRIGPGRAMLYGTSEEFLHFFGLNSLNDLPHIESDNIFDLEGK